LFAHHVMVEKVCLQSFKSIAAVGFSGMMERLTENLGWMVMVSYSNTIKNFAINLTAS